MGRAGAQVSDQARPEERGRQAGAGSFGISGDNITGREKKKK